VGDDVLELADGVKIGVRPITVDDRDRLRAHFESLSSESRAKRFLGYVSALGEEQLDYLTDVDHVDHEALVAYRCDDGELVGVARYVRDPERPDRAEVAVAVTDAFQRCGIGRRLMECLATRARQEGVREFTGLLRADNAAARQLIASFEPHATEGIADDLVELAIPVPGGPDAGGDAALYGVLREAAAGRLAAARGSLGRLNHALRQLRTRAKG
jgi:protein lysine acetyltransferase